MDAAGLAGESRATVAPPEYLPFSFGAAGVTVLWCFFHGRGGLGVLFLVWNVFGMAASHASPGAGLVLGIIGWTITILMGVNGSRIAWEERGFASIEEMQSRESGWNVAGGILFAISVLSTLISVIALAS
jgi:hypothetical protein